MPYQYECKRNDGLIDGIVSTFEEANRIGLEHNDSLSGHGGSVASAGSGYQYYCESDACKVPCGAVGGVVETWDEADAIGLDHNATYPGHGGSVSERPS